MKLNSEYNHATCLKYWTVQQEEASVSPGMRTCSTPNIIATLRGVTVGISNEVWTFKTLAAQKKHATQTNSDTSKDNPTSANPIRTKDAL